MDAFWPSGYDGSRLAWRFLRGSDHTPRRFGFTDHPHPPFHQPRGLYPPTTVIHSPLFNPRSSGRCIDSTCLGLRIESRSLPVSVVGGGKGKTSDKSYSLLRTIILETGCKLDVFRLEMCSWLSDQSVEKAFWREPCCTHPCWFPTRCQGRQAIA